MARSFLFSMISKEKNENNHGEQEESIDHLMRDRREKDGRNQWPAREGKMSKTYPDYNSHYSLLLQSCLDVMEMKSINRELCRKEDIPSVVAQLPMLLSNLFQEVWRLKKKNQKWIVDLRTDSARTLVGEIYPELKELKNKAMDNNLLFLFSFWKFSFPK